MEGTGENNNDNDDADDGNAVCYPPHPSSQTLLQGLKTHQYYQVVYHSKKDSHTEGYFTIHCGEDLVAVVIQGELDINQAVDRDIFAIQLYPANLWLGGASTSVSASGNNNDNNNQDNKEELETSATNAGTIANLTLNTTNDQHRYKHQTK